MRVSRSAVPWMVPLFAAIIGVAVVATARLQQQQLMTEVTRSFQHEVELLAQLVYESAQRAGDSVDALYALAEEQLGLTARALEPLRGDGLRRTIVREQVAVWAGFAPDAAADGYWGPVTAETRATLSAEIADADADTLVDDGVAAQLGLICTRLDLIDRPWLLCKDGAPLRNMRRQLGLGELLGPIAQRGISYAAIQDASGIIAGTADCFALSQWASDPALARAQIRERGQLVFRELAWGAGTVLEGSGSFPLPDGSIAVLRVGIDAAPLVALRREIKTHLLALAAIAALLVVLATAVALFWGFAQKRQLAHERALAARDEAQRRWQAIGQMAATVAHEVRNPLNTLQMAAQRLAREFAVAPAERGDFDELVGVLRSEADRVNRVVGDFLELGRPLTLQRERVTASEVVQEAIAPLRLRAEQERKSIVVDQVGDGTVSLDRRRFAQVINNLVGNALDAVSENGRISISHRCHAAGLDLEIADDGPGMDAALLERVQQPFVTTKAHGTGLGLPLARRLVEAHGGTLTLESRPGHGTTIRLFIPPEEDAHAS